MLNVVMLSVVVPIKSIPISKIFFHQQAELNRVSLAQEASATSHSVNIWRSMASLLSVIPWTLLVCSILVHIAD
jgi:hypothetical protein